MSRTQAQQPKSTKADKAEAVLAALSASIDIEVAAHAARTGAAPREVRALQVYDTTPAGLDAFPVVDDRNAPHLRAGEVAVVDPADREPIHGELFAVRYSRGSRIMQAWWATWFGEASWWCVQLDRPDGPAEAAAWMRAGHAIPGSDGPYAPGGLQSVILGRVVGVLAPIGGEVAHG